jgi:hypothetical protein
MDVNYQYIHIMLYISGLKESEMKKTIGMIAIVLGCVFVGVAVGFVAYGAIYDIQSCPDCVVTCPDVPGAEARACLDEPEVRMNKSKTLIEYDYGCDIELVPRVLLDLGQ